ncbi:MAG: antitoxin VapB family protein [Nanoarchaeota archaeon]
MAKQIFISDEVYQMLLKNKGEYDSFSNVIMKKFRQSGNARKIIDRIKKNPLDKSYSIDKNLLKKFWKQWEKTLAR